MTRPLLLPLFSLIVGLYAAEAFSVVLPVACFAPAAILLVVSLFLHSRIPFFLSISLIFFLSGNYSLRNIVAPNLPNHHIANHLTQEPVIVEGVIDNRPESIERGTRVYLQAEQIVAPDGRKGVTGRLALFIGDKPQGICTGDRIRFMTRITRPRNLGLPGEFDYVRYLARKQVFALAHVPTSADVIIMQEGVNRHWQRAIDRVADNLGVFIGTHAAPVEGSILRALLLGDQGRIPQDIKDAYTAAGVNHILSISGFHMGIIATFLFNVLLFGLRRCDNLLIHLNLRRTVLLVTLPILVPYLLLTGSAPATVRSMIMIAVYVIAISLGRESDVLNSLILAAIAILAVSPASLFEVSFQLSFVALWGMVVLTPLLMMPFARVNRPLHLIVMLMMASAAATIATAIPVAFYFHQVSVTGLVANLLVVPLLGYGAVVAGLSSLLSANIIQALGVLLLKVSALLVTASNSIIEHLAGIPVITALSPSALQVGLSYIILSVLSFMKPGRYRIACCCCLVSLIVGISFWQGRGETGMRITFFSIGQGEASLIRFPNGQNMLIDGGGSLMENGRDVGEKLLAPALWSSGIDRLDFVVLTHPHPDHLQGLCYIVRHFPVGEFWEGPMAGVGDDYMRLKQELNKKEIPTRTVTGGSSHMTVGNVTVTPIAPRALPLKNADANEASLVLKISLEDFSVLFTGDIGNSTEQELAGRPELLKSVILKVPHHGSKHSSSSSFIAAVSPKYAVISAGYNNQFHLPAPQTVNRLQKKGVAVYRTDVDGTIEVQCDTSGKNVRVRTAVDHFR